MDAPLFDPMRHEVLTTRPWDEAAVRATIAHIARDAESAFREDSFWPSHPRDEIEPALSRLKNLHLGAAGMVWALHHLAVLGAIELTRDWRGFAATLPDRYRQEPDAGEFKGPLPSLWLGEMGVHLAAHTLAPQSADLSRILELVQTNRENPTCDLVWGSPGTMLAAQVIHERTGDARFAAAWQSSADWLWSQWRDDVWTQNFHGTLAHILGPAHGFAGNVAILARGSLLAPSRRVELEQRTVATMLKHAMRRDRFAQWPDSLDPRPKPRPPLTQWCYGAPGIVASLAQIAPTSDELTRLLCAGGELIWQAGPLAKGAGLCHGTAGNGYAFLQLFHRTRDIHWLNRARQFAMHAIEQIARETAIHSRGRYTLWTGDIGTAIYLHNCITGTHGFPTIDIF